MAGRPGHQPTSNTGSSHRAFARLGSWPRPGWVLVKGVAALATQENENVIFSRLLRVHDILPPGANTQGAGTRREASSTPGLLATGVIAPILVADCWYFFVPSMARHVQREGGGGGGVEGKMSVEMYDHWPEVQVVEGRTIEGVPLNGIQRPIMPVPRTHVIPAGTLSQGSFLEAWRCLD